MRGKHDRLPPGSHHMHEHRLSWKIRNYPGHPSRAPRQALKPHSFQFLSDPGKPPAARSYFNLITDQKNSSRSLAVLEFGVSPHTLEIKGSQIGLDRAKPIAKLCYSGPCSSKLQPALASILQILPEFCSSTHFETPNPANESPFPGLVTRVPKQKYRMSRKFPTLKKRLH